MKWLFSLFSPARQTIDKEKFERYRKFRELGRRLNVELAKSLPPPALPEAGKKLGLYKAGTLILNQDDEISIAYDYCVHHYRRAGRNAIDRMLEQTQPENGDERSYLEVMASADFSVFRLDEILPHQGARLTDLINGETFDLMDMSLCSTAQPGLIITGRILAFDDFRMSSGTLVPVPEPVFDKKIEPVIRKFRGGDDGEPGGLSGARRAALEAQVLRIALHAGGEDNSFFTDIDN